MAVGIENMPNIDTTHPADYPNGIVKDNPGNGSGTPCNKITIGDMYAFFDKVLREAGIVANGAPDNETNGHQYYEALKGGPWGSAGPKGTHWINQPNGAYYGMQAKMDITGVVLLRGCVQRNNNTSGDGEVICTLLAPWRPLKQKIFTVPVYSIAYGGRTAANITIDPNGEVTALTTTDAATALDLLNGADDYLCFDGINFTVD